MLWRGRASGCGVFTPHPDPPPPGGGRRPLPDRVPPVFEHAPPTVMPASVPASIIVRVGAVRAVLSTRHPGGSRSPSHRAGSRVPRGLPDLTGPGSRLRLARDDGCGVAAGAPVARRHDYGPRHGGRGDGGSRGAGASPAAVSPPNPTALPEKGEGGCRSRIACCRSSNSPLRPSCRPSCRHP